MIYWKQVLRFTSTDVHTDDCINRTTSFILPFLSPPSCSFMRQQTLHFTEKEGWRLLLIFTNPTLTESILNSAGAAQGSIYRKHLISSGSQSWDLVFCVFVCHYLCKFKSIHTWRLKLRQWTILLFFMLLLQCLISACCTIARLTEVWARGWQGAGRWCGDT